MGHKSNRLSLIVAEDDPEDRILLEKALGGQILERELRFLDNGKELLDFLKRRGKFADEPPQANPLLVLLDLNMPVMTGLEALAEIKNCTKLRKIPVVVMSTSDSASSIERCYELGANSYIVKPSNFTTLSRKIDNVLKYWSDTVALPSN